MCLTLTMNRLLLVIRVFAAVVLLSGSAIKTPAQTAAPRGEAVLRKLADPVYPQVARTAHITGDIELEIEVRRDGTAQSASVISGPPLLRQAALDSAEQSQFECLKCVDTVTPVRMLYTFQLAQSENPCAAMESGSENMRPLEPIHKVLQSGNHITLVDEVLYICDPIDRRIRSVKCLYLWRCGSR